MLHTAVRCCTNCSGLIKAFRSVVQVGLGPNREHCQALYKPSKTYLSSSRAMTSMEQGPPPGNSVQPTAASAIDMVLLLGKLKVNKRTGWVLKNVKHPESIADHMYRMAMMAMMAGDCGVDSNRCIRMAIVHDVAEAIVGDITPHCGVSKSEKHALEQAAIQRIKDTLGAETAAAHDIVSLWNEYEEGSTPEAQLVKDIDKLEMIAQAYEYEGRQALDLQDFFASTAGRFHTQTGKAWAAELVARRSAAKTAQSPT